MESLPGSCWAFSVVAAVEGLNHIRTKSKLVSLSTQELVDCDYPSNDRCQGGTTINGYDFVMRNGGLATDEKYPYKAVNEPCRNPKIVQKNDGMIDGYEKVPKNNEKALRKAVSKQPVSVDIDSRNFQNYTGGIFKCSCGTDPDHAMTVVGYGISQEKIKYWILKNSWGTEWGEGGYMLLKRDIKDSRGCCGIATRASYPTKEKKYPLVSLKRDEL